MTNNCLAIYSAVELHIKLHKNAEIMTSVTNKISPPKNKYFNNKHFKIPTNKICPVSVIYMVLEIATCQLRIAQSCPE